MPHLHFVAWRYNTLISAQCFFPSLIWKTKRGFNLYLKSGKSSSFHINVKAEVIINIDLKTCTGRDFKYSVSILKCTHLIYMCQVLALIGTVVGRVYLINGDERGRWGGHFQPQVNSKSSTENSKICQGLKSDHSALWREKERISQEMISSFRHRI